MEDNLDMMMEDAIFPHLADGSMADPTCELEPYGCCGTIHPEDHGDDEPWTDEEEDWG